jgi:hypothetical protein
MSGMTTVQVDNPDFYAQTLGLSAELLSDIFDQLLLIEDFQNTEERIRNLRITRLTQSLSQFVELTTLFSKLLMVKRNINIPEIKQSHIHLLFILKGVAQAQQKQDLFVLEDLIKHELKDNLTQWKIDLIPQARRLLNI